MTPNQQAFLDMIAHSEIGPALLAVSDNGYNVLVGSTPARPLLFDSYGKHPGILNKAMNSTAAGRYQLLYRYWLAYTKQLKLAGFGHEVQDVIALQQIKECRALAAIEAGNIELAIKRCAHIWASLPGAGYGQHENSMDVLVAAYLTAGGGIA